jgi:hypothetical protein
MPTVVLQYVLADEGVYNVKAGGGVGYHFVTLVTRHTTVDERLAGSGLGILVDVEANTAFGDHFFGYIGGDIRWEFIGRLKRQSPSRQSLPAPTMQAFSLGVRLGFSYYF